MGKNNNILLVAYYFYPYAMVGAKRISYMAEYFSRKGDLVTVLKAPNESYGTAIDHELKVSDKVNVISLRNNVPYNTVKQKVLSAWKFYNAIKLILKVRPVDALVFSGSPFFYFPVGILCRLIHRTPYILDFRDPWIAAQKRKEELNWKGNLSRIIERFLEYLSISLSKYTMYVSDLTIKEVSRQYPSIPKTKFLKIMNGFNELKVPVRRENTSKEGKIKLGIFGKFSYYNREHARILVDGLKQLKIDSFEVHHIGEADDYLNQLMTDYFSKESIFSTGYLNYTEGIEYLMNMDILILNTRFEEEIGTKVFEYFYINKPIFAFVGKQSAIWELLSQYKNTYLIQSTDDVVKAINKIRQSNDNTVIDPNEVLQYSRKFQCEKLYEHLRESWKEE